MKKTLALLLTALLLLVSVPLVSAAPPNPFTDKSVNIMEIENFDTGYPAGDVSTWDGFWSYNVEIGFASAVGQINKGKLAITACGQDSFLFNRAGGPVSSALLQKADGIGFYVKNGTRTTIEVGPYGTGSKANKDKGSAAMFFFNGGKATFVSMDGKVSTLTSKDNQFPIPAGAEGYLLTDFSDFVDGWHNNVKLDLSKTDLAMLGFRMNATVNVRRYVEFDHYFLYGKNLKNAPGTVKLGSSTPPSSTTTTTKATTTTTKATGNKTINTTAPTSAVAPVASDTALSTSAVPTDSTVPTETVSSSVEEPTSTESVTTTGSSATQTSAPEKSGMKPLTLVLILCIILVVAVGSILLISIVKKSKVSGNGKNN